MAQSKKYSGRDLCIVALLTALVMTFTMVLPVPVPATNGYIHLGDSMIFIAAILFGPKEGAVAGGLGSAMADVLTGYSHWALPTLLIKSLMGFLAGAIANQKSPKVYIPRNFFGVLAASIWMVFGYFIFGALLKGSFLVSLTSVPSNVLQAAGGSIIFFVLAPAMKKVVSYRTSH